MSFFTKRVSLSQALFWIIGSTLVISGSAYAILKEMLHREWQKAHAPENQVSILVQTGAHKEALKTVYLAELMELSTDRQTSAYRFNPQEAERKLRASPVIKEAHVKVMPPDTVYVDYTVRLPVAWLCEYENTAMDAEGYLFPVNPFFSPKMLPEISLGLTSFPGFNQQLEGEEITLAFSLLNILNASSEHELFKVKRIDVARAFADSYGTREIVLMLEDEIHKKIGERECSVILPRFLRLSTKNYSQELGNYLNLREKMLQQEEEKWSETWSREQITETASISSKAPPKIIDLRLSQLAFIEEK